MDLMDFFHAELETFLIFFYLSSKVFLRFKINRSSSVEFLKVFQSPFCKRSDEVILIVLFIERPDVIPLPALL